MLGRTVCKSMVTFLLESWATTGGLRSRRDPEEAVVVVGGVVARVRHAGRASAAHDPARSAIRRTGRHHRVLAVVAVRVRWQMPLAVAEHGAVALVREW